MCAAPLGHAPPPTVVRAVSEAMKGSTVAFCAILWTWPPVRFLSLLFPPVSEPARASEVESSVVSRVAPPAAYGGQGGMTGCCWRRACVTVGCGFLFPWCFPILSSSAGEGT